MGRSRGGGHEQSAPTDDQETAGAGLCKKTTLPAWERDGVAVTFALPRSPPGSPAAYFELDPRMLGQRTRPVLNEKKRKITMADLQQLDLLKQQSATLWNTWREEHPDTVIELNGVDLSEANLGEVNLAEADLGRANLREADLNHANLSKARLAGADLSGANLAAADLSDADVSKANLSHANLTEANLVGSNLRGAILDEAQLNWATLEGALITPEQLSQARAGT